MLILIYYREASSLEAFILSMIAFGSGIFMFIRTWLVFEKMLVTFDYGLIVIVSIIKFFSILRENKENEQIIIESYKTLTSFLNSQKESRTHI